MKLFLPLSAVTVLAAGLLLSATFQDKKGQEPKGAPAAGDAAMPMPKPGPEHELLKKGAGTWDAVIKMGDQESKGTEGAQMQMNGLWLVYQFRCENMMGSPFQGAGATTWSPDEKKYVSTWVDSMSTDVDVAEGVASKDGKTITWTATTRDPMTRKKIQQKRVQEFKDDDHHTLTFYGPGPDGKEAPAMSIEYTRRKK
jgi:hypothetical protein